MNMKAKNVYKIIKKEIKSYLVNPATYIIAGVFVAVWEFLFFQNAFIIGEASLAGLFSLLTWFFMLLVPAIMMGSIAEEKNKYTLEILSTQPISDWDIIMGKALSGVIFIFVLLLASLPIAISFGFFGNIDIGVYVGQYIAALLLAFLFVSITVATSSLFKSQVPALMLSVVIIFGLIIFGFDIVTMSLPAWLGGVFSRLSVLTHYNSIARGVLDLRDVWYFAFFTFFFLEIAHFVLTLRRSGKTSNAIVREKLILLGLTVLLIVTSGLGLVPVSRFDMTEGNVYTLTDATKNIVSNLPDEVNIILYASDNLPAQYQPILRNVKDVLRDYKTYGNSKLKIEYKNPNGNDDVASEAQKNGIVPAQFNMVGNGELQVKQSYFGIVVKSSDEKKTIPLIQDTSDLEYKLTSFINELTNTNKKKITFLLGEGESIGALGLSKFSSELEKQFDVDEFVPTEATTTIATDTAVLIVSGASNSFDDLKEKTIADAFDNGKNVLFMIDTVNVNTNYMMASFNGTSTNDVLGKYGVTVNNDMVYDLRSNQTIQVGGGMIRYFVPYPFFVQAVVNTSVLPGSNITNVTIPWGSSISVNGEVLASLELENTPLVYTTKFAGSQSKNLSIDPNQKFDSSDLGVKNLAVLVKSQDNDKYRFIVVGDSDFISDSIGSEENIAFGMDMVSYLAQEDSLAGIKIKQSVSRPLMFENGKQILFVRYGNIAGAVLLIIFTGAFIIGRRRKLAKKTYKDN